MLADINPQEWRPMETDFLNKSGAPKLDEVSLFSSKVENY